MARGWESKDVEARQEMARAERRSAPPRQRAPNVSDLQQKRDGLLLSRTRVLNDLKAATHPRHRALLESGLRFLEEQIAAVERAMGERTRGRGGSD